MLSVDQSARFVPDRSPGPESDHAAAGSCRCTAAPTNRSSVALMPRRSAFVSFTGGSSESRSAGSFENRCGGGVRLGRSSTASSADTATTATSARRARRRLFLGEVGRLGNRISPRQ